MNVIKRTSESHIQPSYNTKHLPNIYKHPKYLIKFDRGCEFQFLIRVRNSSLVFGSSRKTPNIVLVTVLLFIFCTPLITMHMCLQSNVVLSIADDAISSLSPYNSLLEGFACSEFSSTSSHQNFYICNWPTPFSKTVPIVIPISNPTYTLSNHLFTATLPWLLYVH